MVAVFWGGGGLFILHCTERCREEKDRQADRQTDGRELAHQLRSEGQLAHAKALGQDFLSLPLEQTNLAFPLLFNTLQPPPQSRAQRPQLQESTRE